MTLFAPLLLLGLAAADDAAKLEVEYRAHVQCHGAVLRRDAVFVVRKLIAVDEMIRTDRLTDAIVTIAKKQGKTAEIVIADMEQASDTATIPDTEAMTDQEIRDHFALSDDCTNLLNQLNGAES